MDHARNGSRIAVTVRTGADIWGRTMSTKGNSGGDDFFDDFEDDFFKSGEDDAFWSDDTLDAYDASAAVPEEVRAKTRDSLDEPDAAPHGSPGAESPAVPDPPPASPRAEAFVPDPDRAARSPGAVPAPSDGPFIMPLPGRAGAAAVPEGDNAPDSLPNASLFSQPTLIFPPDDDEAVEEGAAPAAQVEVAEVADEPADDGVGDAPSTPVVPSLPPPPVPPPVEAGRSDSETLSDEGLLRQDTVEVPRRKDTDLEADDFANRAPDVTVIRPREARDGPAGTDSADIGYSDEEVRLAREERAARRVAEGSGPGISEPAPIATDAVVGLGYSPAAGADGTWSEAADALEREAAAVDDGRQKARLLGAAGRIHFSRRGSWSDAERCFEGAIAAGETARDVFIAYGHVVANDQAYEKLRNLLVQRADATEGGDAAEALHDAALVTRNHLRDDAGAVDLLRRAVAQAPEDWFSLRLLREQLHRTQSWASLVAHLGTMADVAGGAQAARLLVEQGRVLEQHLDRGDDARTAYAAALDADPTSVEAFLSLERLAVAGADHSALAALYQAAADRTEGSDAAFFFAKAARAADAADDAETATTAWQAAIDAAGPGAVELLHEQQSFLARVGAASALRDSLMAEAGAVQGPARAAALLRLGRLLESALADPAGALTVYQDALAADANAAPAADAVSRLLRQTGRFGDLLSFMQEQLDAIDDPNAMVTMLYRMGELCEGPLADDAGAQQWYERIVEAAPGYLPALEGLERVYTGLGEWAKLASVYEQRATLASDPAAVALQLHRAGSVFENRLGDAERGLHFYTSALDSVADFPPSLGAHNRLATAAGDWDAVAAALLRAAGATDDTNAEVSLTYRAARVLADHAGDADAAMTGLRRCLELSPGFRPAVLLLRDLAAETGAWHDVYRLQQSEADATQDPDGRAWRMLAAADAASRLEDVDALGVIQAVLDESPSHAGAQAALELQAHRQHDSATLLMLLRQRAGAADDDVMRARVGARMADIASASGDDTSFVQALSEVINADVDGRPLHALAQTAERLGFWEEAERALAAEKAASARARVLEAWSQDADAVVEAWRLAFDAEGSDARAAAGLERALSRAGSRDGLAAAHGRIADAAVAPPVASVHALLAGHLLEADGETDAARERYGAAFAARPGAGKAFDALRRLAVQSEDADAISALYSEAGADGTQDHVDALETAGAHSAAADVLRARLQAEPADLEALVHLEQILGADEQWKEAFEVLRERFLVTVSEEERASISAKRRWILAEHLSDTDEAWDFYRQLHEETPEDAEVLEALAGIAGARGESGLAVEYLEGLASMAAGAEAARYQRRIADVHAQAGDTDATKAALMRALDHEPENLAALEELRRIHTDAEDWRSLVGVLAREATVVEGTAQVERYREIASVWESRIDEPAVAMDAWRKVLDLSADDPTALEHLVALSRSVEDWSAFADYGQAWLRHAPEDTRVALQSELGRVLYEHLRREDEALRFLDAASSGDAPDLDAAGLLERVYEARGNWAMAVDGVLRQARASDGDDALRHFIRAARRRLETLHDRDGAADIYRQVLAVDEDNGEALRFLGGHLYDAGDLEGAVGIYARMVDQEAERDLDDFDVQIEVALFFFRFAESLRQLERPDEALVRYEQGLKLNSSHLPSLEAVGPLYMAAERWDAAAKVYRQILQLTGGQGDPERLARTYTSLGKVEFHLGNLDKAKKRFNKALELRANDIRALQGIASVLFARGDWNNLLNVYNNIIYHAQEPGEVVDAYLTKGFVLDAKMELPEKARQHYEKSLAFDPSQPAALLRLAELALRQQDWPEAVVLADRGLALEPEANGLVAGLQLVRAVAHSASGDSSAAKAARAAARAADVTLDETVGGDETGWEQLHEVLLARLQAQL